MPMARDYRAEYRARVERAQSIAKQAGTATPSARESAGHRPLRQINTAAGTVIRTGGDAVIDAAIRRAAARGESVGFVVNRPHRGGSYKTHTIGNRASDGDVIADLIDAGGGDRTGESAGTARAEYAPLDTRGGRGRPTVDVVPGQLDPAQLLDLYDLYESWWALLADVDDDRDLYG